MGYVRICYVLELRSGGLWGSGKRLLEADTVSTICRHASGLETPCIPATYIKGLLRRSLEEMVHHIERLRIIDSENIVDEIFGSLTPFKDTAFSKPCNTMIAPLYPVKGWEVVAQLTKSKPLEYLYRGDILAIPTLYGEPHVRIDDRSYRAATGALYRELRVVPTTLFYGEIVYYPSDDFKALYGARALALAILYLNYRYAGRKTLVHTYIAGIEPSALAEDNLMKLILTKRSRPLSSGSSGW